MRYFLACLMFAAPLACGAQLKVDMDCSRPFVWDQATSKLDCGSASVVADCGASWNGATSTLTCSAAASNVKLHFSCAGGMNEVPAPRGDTTKYYKCVGTGITAPQRLNLTVKR